MLEFHIYSVTSNWCIVCIMFYSWTEESEDQLPWAMTRCQPQDALCRQVKRLERENGYYKEEVFRFWIRNLKSSDLAKIVLWKDKGYSLAFDIFMSVKVPTNEYEMSLKDMADWYVSLSWQVHIWIEKLVYLFSIFSFCQMIDRRVHGSHIHIPGVSCVSLWVGWGSDLGY